jgi:hypothetical protein
LQIIKNEKIKRSHREEVPSEPDPIGKQIPKPKASLVVPEQPKYPEPRKRELPQDIKLATGREPRET